MRLIKISLIASGLGLLCLLISYFSAGRLEQAKTSSFPESVFKHYAQASGKVFEGNAFGEGSAVEIRKTIPVDANAPIDLIEIETTAVRVELLPSSSDDIEIELNSNRVSEAEPLLIDTSRGKTLRLMTHEGSKDRPNTGGWFIFNFSDDDSKPKKNNALVVKLPKSISGAAIRTVSGDGILATAISKMQFQSQSGDMRISIHDNPLARVETLSVETVSGDLKGPGRFDHLRFNSVSGDIRLSSFDRVLDMDAQSVSGDLEIETTDVPDTKIDFSTKSGDLKVDKNFLGSTAAPKKNSVFVLGKGTSQIKFQSVSGDLKLSRPGSTDDESNDQENQDPDEDESSAETKSDSSGDEALFRPEDRRVVPTDASAVASLFRSAESSLSCVARAALADASRMGSLSAKRCIRVIVLLPNEVKNHV